VMRRYAPRVTFMIVLAVVASGIAAGSLAAKTKQPLKITAPGRAFQGKVALVSVNSGSFACRLSVRYANGDKLTNMSPATVQKTKSAWKWSVAEFAAAGQAKLTAACPGGKATKAVIVVGGLIPPRVEVVKKGFSARVKGSNENVSYGLVLQN